MRTSPFRRATQALALAALWVGLNACGGGGGTTAGSAPAAAPAAASNPVVAPKDVGEVSAYIDPAGQSSELSFSDSSGYGIYLAGGRTVGNNIEWSTLTAVIGQTTSQIAFGPGNVPSASVTTDGQSRWVLDLAQPEDMTVWRYQDNALVGGARIKLVGNQIEFYEVGPGAPSTPGVTLSLEAAQMQRLRLLAEWPWMRPTVVVVALTRLAARSSSAQPGLAAGLPGERGNLSPKLVTAVDVYTNTRYPLESEVANPTRLAGLTQEASNRSDAGLQAAFRDAPANAQVVIDQAERDKLTQIVEDQHNQLRYTHSAPDYVLTMSELVLGLGPPGTGSQKLRRAPGDAGIARTAYGDRLFRILVAGTVQGLSAAYSSLTAPLRQAMAALAASNGNYAVTATSTTQQAPVGGGNTGMFCSHPDTVFDVAPRAFPLLVVGAAGLARFDGMTGLTSSDGKHLLFDVSSGKQRVLVGSGNVSYFSEQKRYLTLTWDAALPGYQGTYAASIITSWSLDATQVECTTVQAVTFKLGGPVILSN